MKKEDMTPFLIVLSLLLTLFSWRNEKNDLPLPTRPPHPLKEQKQPKETIKQWQSKKVLPLESELDTINYKLEHLFDQEKQIILPPSFSPRQKRIKEELQTINTHLEEITEEPVKKQPQQTPLPITTPSCTLPHHQEQKLPKEPKPSKDPLVNALTNAIEDLHNKWHEVAIKKQVSTTPKTIDQTKEETKQEHHEKLLSKHLLERAFLHAEEKRIRKTLQQIQRSPLEQTPQDIEAQKQAAQQVLRIAAKLERKRPIPKSELTLIEEQLQNLEKQQI